MKFEKYPKYKDSGIEWIGEIPEHWEVLANKYIFKLKKKLVGKMSNKYDLLSLTLRGIIKRDMENPEGKFPAEFNTYQEVKKGDFIFCLFDVEETPRTVGLSNFDGMITGAYTVFESSELFSKSYLYYRYLGLDHKKSLKFLYKGLRNTIPKESFFSLKTHFPPKNEQIAIANFLDKKCEKIDKAVKQKEDLIKLLKEQKQIIIQNAVTKGIEFNRKMKDSGVEWIGEIPEEWEIKKLKYVARIFRGKFTHRPRNDPSLYDGKYPFFQTGDVARAEKYLFNFRQTLNEKGLKVSTLIPKGTVVITIAANIGDIAILEIDACFPDSIVGFEPNKIVSKYFFYNALKIMKEQFINSTIKNTQMNLNVERIGNNFMPIPPKMEQEEILNYVELQSSKIDKSIKLQEKQIEKLKEYKETLINSVVTGKVKV